MQENDEDDLDRDETIIFGDENFTFSDTEEEAFLIQKDYEPSLLLNYNRRIDNFHKQKLIERVFDALARHTCIS